ncbi:MAG: hypothetical protein ACM3OF_08540 [Gemmatimonas sp.]
MLFSSAAICVIADLEMLTGVEVRCARQGSSRRADGTLGTAVGHRFRSGFQARFRIALTKDWPVIGFVHKRLAALSAKGAPLEAIDRPVPWETFRADRGCGADTR